MSTAADVAPLSPHAAEEVADLWREAGLVRPWNDPVGDFLRAVDGEGSAVLGAVSDGAVLATAMVGLDGHRGWVYYVAVRRAHRGTGLGAAMMRAAEGWLRAAGAPKVQLMVRQGNTDVVGFYEALGYTDQGTVVMGRFLDPELEALRRAQA